ncbi:MAG: hypothetical protein BM564_05715 [Bacteroidetes bacterium MedPE-SWsnd-G2]|nr:MAG: hypothetical protein BM564_05715 [Bacteroidetes bacterium MedPE-SWsnd-G2]
MKTIALFIAVFLTSFIGQAQPKAGQSITVTINNVSSDEGKVNFALHNENTFMKLAPLQVKQSKINSGKVEVTFTEVTPGEYAILVFHDANNNNQMDFDTNGMPQESYGMSNNPMSYGPPQYNDSKFALGKEDIELAIRF